MRSEHSPDILIGTVAELVAKLHACRHRWGISYFVVRELDDFFLRRRCMSLITRP